MKFTREQYIEYMHAEDAPRPMFSELLGTKEKDLHNYMIFHSTRGTFAVRQGDWKLNVNVTSNGAQNLMFWFS